MGMERDAKEIQILRLIDGWPSAKLTDSQIDIYLDAVEGCSVEAVVRSVSQFITGKVSRNNSYLPVAAELAANAAVWDEAIATVTADRAIGSLPSLYTYAIGDAPPDGMVPLGPTKVDFGHGLPIDMRNMSHAEKEAVLISKGAPPPDAKLSASVGVLVKRAARKTDE